MKNQHEVLETGNRVAVATSAYGARRVIQLGHAHFVPIVAAAGSNGIEICRELQAEHDDHTLRHLGDEIRRHQLPCVYSTSTALWPDAKYLALGKVARLLHEASVLGAKAVNMTLGCYDDGAHLERLGLLLATSQVRLWITNDQSRHGGTIAPLAAFFAQASRHDVPVGMAFDTGNWHWNDVDPFEAARHFSPFVEYIHCKSVRRSSGGLHTFPLTDDPAWRSLLKLLPSTALRGIAFPIVGADLAEATRRYVDLIAQPPSQAGTPA